jgi:hypothetical protein
MLNLVRFAHWTAQGYRLGLPVSIKLGGAIRMRDYLYVWHDPEQRFLVASGIEFKDFLPCLKSQGGIVLLDHQSETATHDQNTSFDFVQASDLSELAAEDIYSWGNFVWADYASPTFPFTINLARYYKTSIMLHSESSHG